MTIRERRRKMFGILHNKKGFTLIELIIVIIIIAVLAAIAAPMMTGNVQRARRAEAVAGCGAIRTAARIWQTENAGIPTLAQAQTAVGMTAADLTGPNYTNANYTITAGGQIQATSPAAAGSIQVNMDLATGFMNGN